VSVYRRGGVYWYDFRWRGRRYRASTHQRLKDDAQLTVIDHYLIFSR
jgi:hypothetical protein